MTTIPKTASDAAAEAVSKTMCPTCAPFSATSQEHQDYCRKVGDAAVDAALPLISKEVAAMFAVLGELFPSDGNEEDHFVDHMAHACPYCGGSGHKDDVRQPTPAGFISKSQADGLLNGYQGVWTVSHEQNAVYSEGIYLAAPQSPLAPDTTRADPVKDQMAQALKPFTEGLLPSRAINTIRIQEDYRGLRIAMTEYDRAVDVVRRALASYEAEKSVEEIDLA